MISYQTAKIRGRRGETKTLPAIPTGLSATPTPNVTITLDWADAVGATSYKVYRSSVIGSYGSVVGTPASSTYVDTVTEGLTYYYRVTAVNASGESGYSSQVSAVAQGDYVPPAWTIPDIVGVDATLSNIAKGSSGEISNLYAANDGTPYFTIQSKTAAGGSDTSGITINSSTGAISVSETTPADSYTLRIGLDSANAVESDWATRSQGAGVVWAHNFQREEELTQFSVQTGIGNPVIRTLDSQVGWCIEHRNNAGGYDSTSTWARPLAPIVATSNGLPDPDPAKGATLTRRAWSRAYPTNNADYRMFGYGYYGHTGTQAAYSTFTPPGGAPTITGGQMWDGNELYIQFRVRFDGNLWSAANNALDTHQVKYFLLTTSGNAGLGQLAGQVAQTTPYWYQTFPFDLYTCKGRSEFQGTIIPLGSIQGQQSYPSSVQPGGEYASTCVYGTATNVADKCWEWPTDQWVTVLLHIKPGRHNPFPTISYRETQIDAYVSTGGSAYRTLWSKTDYAWVYGDNEDAGVFTDTLPGFNMFQTLSYANVYALGNPPIATEYTIRFAQVICSQSPIPAPQDGL